MNRHFSILSIGSGKEHMEKRHKFGKKKHTYVEPALHRVRFFEKARLIFREAELSTKTAHEFLDFAIRKKRTYEKIEINMPLGGIARKKNFELLCEKMKRVLKENGQVEILTDIEVEHAKEMPFGIFHEKDPKKGIFDHQLVEPADLIQVLRKVGFEVKLINGNNIPSEIIKKSPSARQLRSQKYLSFIIATKK